MAIKNSIKTYLENSYYHLYNRGVEKRNIFNDEQDYAVFLSYLKTYLIPKDEENLRKNLANPQINYRQKNEILQLLRLNNFSSELILLAYCLMPNHFHLLVKQKSPNTIDSFMNSLCVRFSMFKNKKYKRVGPLYESVYKAVLVDSEEQLLYLTSYIHRNPLKKNLALKDHLFQGYISQPSSFPEYLGQRKTEWVHSEEILVYFSKTNPRLSYQSFIDQTEDYSIVSKKLIDY